jgi:hypothetical protein
MSPLQWSDIEQFFEHFGREDLVAKLWLLARNPVFIATIR